MTARREGAGGAEVLRVAVVTNVLPHYREAFYRLLFGRTDLEVQVYCQAGIPGVNLRLIHERFPERVTLVPAWSLRRGVLGWQRLPWRHLTTSFDVLCVHGDARTVSNVALSVVARALGKPTVIWGQAHTAGAGGLTERIRLWWWRRFPDVLVYTEREARWLIERRGFRRHRVVGMNNGLDQRRIDEAAGLWYEGRLAAWQEREGLAGRTVVLSCARLEAKNRFDLWVSAMPAVRARHPELLWAVIGEGPERSALEAQARGLGVEGSVRWLGALYDEQDLAPWFALSRVLVHPGAIGLTLLHASGYGLPVVTHDDPAAHMPEFAAFEPGQTGLTYRREDARDLAKVASLCLADEARCRRMGERARRVAREDYNVTVMAERFATAIRQSWRRR